MSRRRPRRLLPLGVLAIVGGMHSARAEVSPATFATAQASMRQYAEDMMLVVPCLYMFSMSPPDGRQIASNYVSEDLADGLRSFAAAGGSPKQVEALRQLFTALYRPQWDVPDIRVLARQCFPYFSDITGLQGKGTPLPGRPGFH